jgi:hypothetical protein
MTLYSSPTARTFDGEYVIATLLNQSWDLRNSARHCASTADADRMRERAQELETAAELLDLTASKLFDAYRAIGSLSHAAGLFGESGVSRAMDYMSDGLSVMDEGYRFTIEEPTLRLRLRDWIGTGWHRTRRALGHRYGWEKEIEEA